MPRCPWATMEEAIVYHDEEWGAPVHNDRVLFEFLILEGAQAGLSWNTILKKRENYRKALDGFRAEKIARYGAREVRRLLADAGIVRNRLKIAATIQNAQALLTLQGETTLDAHLWSFVGGKTKQNRWRSMAQVPAKTAESDAMSRDLLGRGFKFVGSTICYALMQATGMVNDHLVSCPRHAELAGVQRPARKRSHGMAKKSEKKPWKKSAPKKSGHTKLTAKSKAKAKASAKRAGRKYPNLVDNMKAAKKQKSRK